MEESGGNMAYGDKADRKAADILTAGSEKSDNGQPKRKKLSGWKKGLLIVAVLAVWWFLGWLVTAIEKKKILVDYPPEKVEAYLEKCFNADMSVTFNEAAYNAFSMTDYIPYEVTTVLEDGTPITYDAYWEKDYIIDDGVSTTYRKEMLTYYGEKYGIPCEIKEYSTYLRPTWEDLEGNPPPMAEFLETLYNSSYIQGGQEFEFDIYGPGNGYLDFTMSLEEPYDLQEILADLSSGK